MERTFDWVSRHDERSKGYGLLSTGLEPQKVYWKEGAVLDQGREGACVGFGWTGELLASPMPDRRIAVVNGNSYASGVYHRAKQIDEWEGVNYEGTSVLAGAKVIRERGYITGYRWCFTIEQVRDAIIGEGPVVIGIPWYDGMYDTRPSGLVDVSGRLVGGHCILLTGYHPRARINGEGWFKRHEVFKWRNSWGTSYGKSGSGWIAIDDLERLLKENGEACVPMGRTRVRIG